jgi:hypothetical protein
VTESRRPLELGKTPEANLALVTTWLKRNNTIVDEFRNWRQKHTSKWQKDLDRYKLMLDREGIQVNFDQMAVRYKQLRDYTCVQVGDTQVFNWNLHRISIEDIRVEDLKTLIAKDMEFLDDLKGTFDECPRGSRMENLGYMGAYKEAHKNASAIHSSIKHITAPGEIAVPTSGPLAGPDSPVSDSGSIAAGDSRPAQKQAPSAEYDVDASQREYASKRAAECRPPKHQSKG